MFETAEVGNRIDQKTFARDGAEGSCGRLLSVVIHIGGVEGAGKSETVNLLLSWMDARGIQPHATWDPTDEEEERPPMWRFWRPAARSKGRIGIFLGSWYTRPIIDRVFDRIDGRFWRHLPRLGRVTIYDRSWYGRVLVERIEGLCAPEDWQRAYAEINAFEEQLTSFGIIVLKFWLAISADEQLRRFKDRETTPYKQYQITEEDWRNRKKWDAYEAAACDMIERTSTEAAPWVLVEANDKNGARIKVMKAVCRSLRKALG